MNREKSAVAVVETRTFLGYQITAKGRLTIAPTRLKRLKARILDATGATALARSSMN
ncbi:MAG: hypothetical protein HC877_10770 [Thioploca sp.]|nr:hypothetical protein [Thioploca sp.]